MLAQAFYSKRAAEVTYPFLNVAHEHRRAANADAGNNARGSSERHDGDGFVFVSQSSLKNGCRLLPPGIGVWSVRRASRGKGVGCEVRPPKAGPNKAGCG